MSTESTKPVLDRILELWNLPVTQRSSRQRKTGYVRNVKRYVPELMELLEEEFEAEEVAGAVRGFLEDAAPRARAGEVRPKRVSALIDWCLRIVAAKGGVLITRAFAVEAVGAFPSYYASHVIKPLIERYLTCADVLVALEDGLARRVSRFNVDSCITGIYLYKNYIRHPPGDPTIDALKARIDAHLASIASGEDEKLAKSAALGRRILAETVSAKISDGV